MQRWLQRITPSTEIIGVNNCHPKGGLTISVMCLDSARARKSLILMMFLSLIRPAQALHWMRLRTIVRINKAQGFALIDLIFVCGIIGLLSGIALPRLLLAKQMAGAASAIGSMRALNSGQLTYALTCGSGFYAPNLTTLGTPPPGTNEAFISGGLGQSDTVIKSNYVIQMVSAPYAGAPGTCNGLAAGESGQGFRAAADPASPNNVRFFGTNANSVIYEHNSTLFADMPEIGEPPTGHPLR